MSWPRKSILILLIYVWGPTQIFQNTYIYFQWENLKVEVNFSVFIFFSYPHTPFLCVLEIYGFVYQFLLNQTDQNHERNNLLQLTCLLLEVTFLSCLYTPAATGTFVLWIVYICITHVYAFRDRKVPAWRKHAEPKLRETREPGIQPDSRGQLSSASDFWYRGVFNVEHWKSDYFSPGKVGNSDHIIHVKSNSFCKFISLHISFRNGIGFFFLSS